MRFRAKHLGRADVEEGGDRLDLGVDARPHRLGDAAERVELDALAAAVEPPGGEDAAVGDRDRPDDPAAGCDALGVLRREDEIAGRPAEQPLVECREQPDVARLGGVRRWCVLPGGLDVGGREPRPAREVCGSRGRVAGGVATGELAQRFVAVRERAEVERAVQAVADLDQHTGVRGAGDDVDRRLALRSDRHAAVAQARGELVAVERAVLARRSPHASSVLRSASAGDRPSSVRRRCPRARWSGPKIASAVGRSSASEEVERAAHRPGAHEGRRRDRLRAGAGRRAGAHGEQRRGAILRLHAEHGADGGDRVGVARPREPLRSQPATADLGRGQAACSALPGESAAGASSGS